MESHLTTLRGLLLVQIYQKLFFLEEMFDYEIIHFSPRPMNDCNNEFKKLQALNAL